MATTRGGEHTGPRSGKNAPKRAKVPRKGKAKMSADKWAKLSKKEKEMDYNGSRFSAVGNETREGAGANPRDVSKTRHSARYGGSRAKQAAARSKGRGGVSKSGPR